MWEGHMVCVYCDMPLSQWGDSGKMGRWEWDHVPLPERHGGTQVVPACKNCHDLKDRVLLGDWDPTDALAAFKSLPPLGRILIVKAAAMVKDAEAIGVRAVEAQGV